MMWVSRKGIKIFTLFIAYLSSIPANEAKVMHSVTISTRYLCCVSLPKLTVSVSLSAPLAKSGTQSFLLLPREIEFRNASGALDRFCLSCIEFIKFCQKLSRGNPFGTPPDSQELFIPIPHSHFPLNFPALKKKKKSQDFTWKFTWNIWFLFRNRKIWDHPDLLSSICSCLCLVCNMWQALFQSLLWQR